MDYRHVLTQNAAVLTDEVDEWDKVALTTGLDPYACKASYICGAMREFMQASGLNLANGYHLGALFLALDAAELLGQVLTGARRDQGDPRYVGPAKALACGVRHLRDHPDPQVAPLPHRPQHYEDLRNFAGHGATHLPPKRHFRYDSTRLLLWHLAHALNTMWEDTNLPTKLAAAEIHPVWTTRKGKPKPVYVTEVQDHLKTSRPGDRLAHDKSWQWTVMSVSTSSPPVTGRG
ncbi:hypothetical protein [Streptomyces sp. IB201691-2A2]|uniref:hypothetical protein n=1 Tax=Streptomyces sp. IB201691-2A2 TaxID=2561920 RepID=UPI001180A596|nr:hypothetical protein [Streptomyces sp. IB201691-2A2]TRO56315.1 hypothetical protein E4K73_46895 [Streptomyces sp. IB201691-2A2]